MAQDLLVNIGNTHTVFALENEAGGFRVWRYPTRDLEVTDLPLGMLDEPLRSGSRVVIGGVVPRAEQSLREHLDKAGLEWTHLDPRVAAVDLQLSYEPLESLGFDRVCKLLAGRFLVPEGDSLLIDMGTAVTVDLLHAGTAHKGGLIMPGEILCLDALAQYTAQLPSVPPAAALSREMELGLDTRRCMSLGAKEMVAGALERVIASARAASPDIEIVATGGAAARFLPLLQGQGPVRHVAEMVLLGMRRLALLQAAKHGVDSGHGLA